MEKKLDNTGLNIPSKFAYIQSLQRAFHALMKYLLSNKLNTIYFAGKDFRIEIRFTKIRYTDQMRVPGSLAFEEVKRNVTRSVSIMVRVFS